MGIRKDYTDAELVMALSTAEQRDEAIRFMYQKYFGTLSNYILQTKGSAQAAEDVFQEVLLTFIEIVRDNKFRGASSVKTFLYSLNRNIWLNELKKRGRQRIREVNYGSSDIGFVDTAELIQGRESRFQMLDMLQRLGEDCKKILRAFYYDNLPMAEILTLTDYENEQIVRNKKYKCMKKLAELIASIPALAQSLKSSRYE